MSVILPPKINMSCFTALSKTRNKLLEFPDLDFIQASKLCIKTSTEGVPHDYVTAVEMQKDLPLDLINFDDPSVLREALKILLDKYDFPWLRLFPAGRFAVKNALSKNEIQVFRNANLFTEDFDMQVVNWWDYFAEKYRNKSSTLNFREFEKRSLDLEIEFLDSNNCPFRPQWIALEDNSAGFDILSYRFDGEFWKPFAIEVKSTVTSRLSFHLTSNESKLASQMKDSYVLHFWHSNETRPLLLDYESFSGHLPTNNGSGKWESVYISGPIKPNPTR